jgi:hypothetical protein
VPDVAEQGEHEDTGSRLQPPPPLPTRLNDLRPLLFTGTALWFVAFAVLLVISLSSGWQPGLWTCLAGFLLGFVGLAISGWQRSAARRGSRGAQTGI